MSTARGCDPRDDLGQQGGPYLPSHARGRPTAARGAAPKAAREPAEESDLLYVNSVEKAFRVLAAFSPARRTLSLTELAGVTNLDRSAAQRFSHTLEKLGYLRKDPDTRRYELTVLTLALGAAYLGASPLVDRALPYLMELSRKTEEAVSLTVLDGTEIVYVARLLSRHALHANIIIGSRLPSYCTAPGIAMLSCLPTADARAILKASDLRTHTPHTTTRLNDLMAKLDRTAQRGYVVTSEELFVNDISIASPVRGPAGEPVAAVNIAVSKLRCAPDEAEAKYAPLVAGAAAAMSQSSALLSR
jgi:IclR family transcriptional regulator, pca regulon regulatory protein